MAQRVVPEFDMANIPISGLPELQSHLQNLVDDADTPFNAKLLDDIELQLTEDNIPPLLPTLLPPLTTILKTTTQDPTPLLSLTVKLLSPLSFTRTLAIADPPSLLSALGSPLPGANLLALAILHKAAAAASDVQVLAGHADVVEELVRCWMTSENTGVAEKAAKVLGDILETDCDVPVDHSDAGAAAGLVNGVNGLNGINGTTHREPGHGHLWRLIFSNRSILSIIPTACDLHASTSTDRTTHQITLSQGRLLRLLTRLSVLNIHALTQTPHQDLFPLAAADLSLSGVLPWATLNMVDTSDILMHLSLIDFFETFVSVMRVSCRQPSRDHPLVRELVRRSAQDDGELLQTLRSLPDRTVEEEAEPLRRYINDILL